MTVIINGVSEEVKNEKEAAAKAEQKRAASYIIQDGILTIAVQTKFSKK